MNAWTCARRSTDRDLESQRAFFVRMLGYVLVGHPTVILPMPFLAYGFRFYFLLVTVIILAGMVLCNSSALFVDDLWAHEFAHVLSKVKRGVCKCLFI